MKKREIEITLEKNLLDLEHNKNFNLYLTCIILSTTIFGLTVSLLNFFELGYLTNIGKRFLAVGSFISIFFLVQALEFRDNYKEKFKEIQNLLKEVKKSKK